MSELNDTNTAPAPAKQRRIGPRQILALVVLALLVVFVAINTQKVKVHLLFTTVHAPLYQVLAAMAVVGALIVLLVQFRRRHRN
jgi:uncharacterized integral membrane protein